MKLHKEPVYFQQAIESASMYMSVEPALIEKDYFVTLFLKSLKEKVPDLLFKGGTSLSKCHKVIDRFSEDIDLTLTPEHQTQSRRRQLKYYIIDVCKETGLKLINEDEIKSRRDYNCYRIEYPMQFPSPALKRLLLVETVFIQKAYPVETKPMNSLIGEWLTETKNAKAIKDYDLQPFDIQVQTLDRTLVDKVFAVCDYMLDNNVERQSRHIYDISRLLSAVQLDEHLKALIKEVREDRKTGVKCYSAKDGIKVPTLIRRVIDSRFYERDYNETTLLLLSKPVTYENAITALEKIIDSGVFEAE